MNAVKEFVDIRAISYSMLDGVRVEQSDGWWLIRASNTEDMILAYAEADGHEYSQNSPWIYWSINTHYRALFLHIQDAHNDWSSASTLRHFAPLCRTPSLDRSYRISIKKDPSFPGPFIWRD